MPVTSTKKKKVEKNIEINLLECMARVKIKTVKELSKRTGLSLTILYDLSNGYKRAIRLDTLVKICKALDCEISDLVVIKKNE
jgi:putative transcriptional regulator